MAFAPFGGAVGRLDLDWLVQRPFTHEIFDPPLRLSDPGAVLGSLGGVIGQADTRQAEVAAVLVQGPGRNGPDPVVSPNPRRAIARVAANAGRATSVSVSGSASVAPSPPNTKGKSWRSRVLDVAAGARSPRA